MTRPVAVLLLSLAGFACRPDAQAACADPTPADSAWWQFHRVDSDEGFEAPEAPAQSTAFRPAALRGSYVLQMTPTVGQERGSRVLADVIISSDSTGVASVRGRWPTYFSLTPDSTKRGDLTILFDGASRRLSLTLGNPRPYWEDLGVDLDVFTVTHDVIVGRWVDGGRGVDAKSRLHPQGWFCLQRRSP